MIGKKRKKTSVIRTRGSGSYTESEFWSLIRSALRQKSRWWKPISVCKMNARRVYKGSNKRQKFEYLCNVCKNYFPEKQINIDHIVPAGTLKCSEDLPGFVARLFVEVEGLQCICETCHSLKTEKERTESKIEKNKISSKRKTKQTK